MAKNKVMQFTCTDDAGIVRHIKQIAENQGVKIFILADTNTFSLCYPLISETRLKQADICIIKAGEENKNLSNLTLIWEFLLKNQADRHSLLLNLGGGMITDLGGFAASTFKRGIRFIHIPTSLMAMVDAAHGGKNGINFMDIKNQIGCFSQPEDVLINPRFLYTLNSTNLLSGYAEMIKHALLDSEEHLTHILQLHICQLQQGLSGQMIARSVEVKKKYVTSDFTDKNIRAALNFGHTFGHAIEALSHIKKAPLTHGYAVAYGLIAELAISVELAGFSQAVFNQTRTTIEKWFGNYEINTPEIDQLVFFMHHDKKNKNSEIRCTLLQKPGFPVLNQILSDDIVRKTICSVFNVIS